MNKFIILSIALMGFVCSTVSGQGEDFLSILKPEEQKCLIEVTPSLVDINRTPLVNDFVAHVRDIIQHDPTGEDPIENPSEQTTQDCGRYVSMIEAILTYHVCDDEGMRALDVWNKLLASPEDDDGFQKKFPHFANVFNHAIVCHAHYTSTIA